MAVEWYIQHRDNDYDSNTQKIIFIIQEMGYKVHCEKYVPFDGMDWSFLPTDRPVVAHGSIAAIRNLLKGCNGKHFYPGAWCDWEALTCHSYYTYWGKYLLQKDYGFYPLGELPRLKDYFYKLHGETIFVRPDANNKEFTGEVISEKNFDVWYRKTTYNDPPATMMCVVSKPAKIEAEFRLIMADGKVVAGSKYRNEHVIDYDPYYPEAMIPFAEEVCKVWQPHPIFCLDIAETPEGFRVIECGSVNCAGYYSANLRPIIESMAKIAEREWKDIHE